MASVLMLASCDASDVQDDVAENYGFRSSMGWSSHGSISAMSVRSVYPCGPAHGRLAYGDRVVSINGTPVGRLQRQKYQQMLIDGHRAGKAALFSIRRTADGLSTRFDVALAPWTPLRPLYICVS